MQLALDRIQAHLARTGLTKSEFYREVNDGVHTPPVKVGIRSAAIPRHEADTLMAAKINGATQEQLRRLVKALLEQRKAIMPASMREERAA